ncbi:MAG: hypothetical protein ACXVB9_06385 [Bdellovibrionota bacterium]
MTRGPPLPNLEIGKRATTLKVIDPTKDASLNGKLSDDLTVILLRGNGSPRTFRLKLPALQRSLTALGFAFAFAIAAAVLLLIWNLLHFTPDRVEITTPAPVATPAPAGPKEAFWGANTTNDEELRKEVAGLREDNARLNAIANGRKDLANGTNSGLLQFFGPRNVPETDSPMQVKNVKVSRNPGTHEIYVDFELHNTDPDQQQRRGYIVVLAKTANSLLSYPENAFSPTQNIVLDFTKGETFGVSRFRQARAVFADGPLEGKHARFQIMLFSDEGKVIADLHVEDQT